MFTAPTDSLEAMRTLVLDPVTAGLTDLLERRRRSGLDRIDEIWEGVYHMVPAPSHAHGAIEAQLLMIIGPAARCAGLEPTGPCNIGVGEHNFRVPDITLHRPGAHGVWHDTAALVVEIVSPGDESWEKLTFYASHRVDEILIVDPQRKTVTWLALEADSYSQVDRSRLIDLGTTLLVESINWPSAEQVAPASDQPS